MKKQKKSAITPQVEDVLIVPPMFSKDPKCHQTIIRNTPVDVRNLASLLVIEVEYNMTTFEEAKKKLNAIKVKLLKSGKLNYKQAAATLLTQITQNGNTYEVAVGEAGYYEIKKTKPRTKTIICHPKLNGKTSISSSFGDILTVKPRVKVWTGGRASKSRVIDAKTYAKGLKDAFREFSLGNPEQYRFI